MSVNSRLKVTKIIGQLKAFYKQRIQESNCVRKETVYIEILVTSRNGDRKIMQSIRKMSRPPSGIRKWNQLSQFRWTSNKVIPIEKTSAGYISTISQWFKRGSKWRTNSPAYSFLQLIQQFQVATTNTSTDMTTLFHKQPYGRFIGVQGNLKRKKFHITNQSSTFPGGCFSNIDNVRGLIQFRRESQPKHLDPTQDRGQKAPAPIPVFPLQLL